MAENPTDPFPVLEPFSRIVIKVGSSLLLSGDARGELRHAWLAEICEEVRTLVSCGKRVLIVTSGAVAFGRKILGLGARATRLEELQASAAAGQTRLAQAWAEALGRNNLVMGQILLTLNDTEERRRYLNARETLSKLTDLGAVPVINENDTVATESLRYGDNDRLAARVSVMIGADLLIILSDVRGLYENAANVRQGAPISHVAKLTPEIEAMAGGAAGAHSRGGMVTKLAAARAAMAAGCHMVIASGALRHPLGKIDRSGSNGTWFEPETTPRSARKSWIAGSLSPQGSLVIDAGAVAALRTGKSLLPAGVVRVFGDFGRGDAVLIKDVMGQEIGRGLVAFDRFDADAIKGKNTRHIETLLGYRGRSEIVHRDDLSLIPSHDEHVEDAGPETPS